MAQVGGLQGDLQKGGQDYCAGCAINRVNLLGFLFTHCIANNIL